MKKSAVLLFCLIAAAGCGSDVPTKPEENARAGDANAESIKSNNESNKSSQDSEKTLPEDVLAAETNDSSAGVLSAALRGKVLRFIERGKGAWMEFHPNGTFYSGTDLNGKPARKWNATGNQVTLHQGDNDQNKAWFVFSDPTLSVGSNIILDLPSGDAPGSKGTKVTILSVTDIPSAAPLDSRLPFTLSSETTHITAPLREDGYPDYVAAINEISSRDVTPENNAFIPLYELIYNSFSAPNAPHTPEHTWFFEERGIVPFKELPPPVTVKHGLRLRSFNWYANQAVGRKAKLELHMETGWYDLSQTPKLRSDQILFADRLNKRREKAVRRPWTRRELPHLARWLDYNEQVLERFRTATRRMRYYTPLLNSGGKIRETLGARVIGTSEILQVANAALVRVTLNLGEGRIEEAIQDALACHRLGRLMCQQPSSLHMITGLARDREACQADMLIAHHAKCTVEQLTTWRQELQRLPPLPKMVDILENVERYLFLDCALSIAQYGPKGFPSTDVFSARPDEWLKVPFNRNLVAQLNRVIDWDNVLREGHRRYDALVAAGRNKTCQERLRALDEWEEAFATSKTAKLNLGMASLQKAEDDGLLQKKANQSIIDGLSRLCFSAGIRGIANDDRALMRNYLVGLSLSLAHYRLEKGSYPENLAQLSPRYIGKVPDDIFVGQPLRYERKETGYLLYSQGPNRKDEAGRPNSDIVFQVPLPSLDEN